MRATLMIIVLASAVPQLAAQQHHPAAMQIGTVSFATTCDTATRADFNRSVALLHSFAFSLASAGFAHVLETDPRCALAWWGLGMSAWGNPFATGIKPAAQIQRGLDAVQHARAAGAPDARERGYIEAVAHLYEHADSLPQRARVLAYREAMADLSAASPADTEAMIFHALARAAAANPADKTYADQLAAGATLERLFAVLPDHPGLAHYIIHAYDVPPLAARARVAADRYAHIAPAVSHALHMPSHTMTRIGAWQQSIASNRAAGEAAAREGATSEQLHTMDYRMYAYLQLGQDRAARRLVTEVPLVARRPGTAVTAAPPSAGHFAAAAIPARYALERGAWADAARLEVHPSPTLYADAVTWFARGLGAARTGDTTGAHAAVAELERLRDALARAGEAYWSEQVEIQRLGALAWLDFAAGRRADGLAGMREAADREAATEKAAVTPGPLAPARELLGDMQLASGDYAAALASFEATLQHEPNRFRAIAGATHAAHELGDTAAERTWAARLLALGAQADRPGRPELAEAARLTRRSR